ncbi:MAG: class I SAM-dependent methyltransferase [Anaerolineales bacterium]
MDQIHSGKEYWERRLGTDFDFRGVGISALGRGYNQWLYQVRAIAFDRVIRWLQLDWPRVDVLDIGSGTGFYIKQWNRLGVHSVTGTDITQIAVDTLRTQFASGNIEQLDITTPSLPDAVRQRSYDVASAFDVLFHIKDDDDYTRALQNIHTILAPKGYLLYSDTFPRKIGEHRKTLVHRTLDEVTDHLQAAGFRIIGSFPMFLVMNRPTDETSFLWRFGWRLMTLPVRVWDPLGWALGAIYFLPEAFLVSLARSSPTTKIMICQKAGNEGVG